MEFIHTKECIYTQCTNRIRARIDETSTTHFDIYPGDKKIISKILNHKIYKKNPYLIQDAVLDSYYTYTDEKTEKRISKHIGISHVLGFDDNKLVLWGDKLERGDYLYRLYQSFIYDLIDNSKNIPFDIEEILSNYVGYAKYRTYWQLLYESGNKVPAYYTGIFEDEVISNIDIARDKAISFLYSKPYVKEVFQNVFEIFIASEDAKSFTLLDKKINDYLLCDKLISVITKYTPSDDSLGLRVRKIILGDLSQMKALVFIPPKYDLCIEKLIQTSSAYIKRLEEFQDLSISIQTGWGIFTNNPT